MAKVYFSETQYFDLLWMKFLLLFASAGTLVPIFIASYNQLIEGKPWGNEAPSDFTLLYITIALLIAVVGINVVIFSSKLETKITSSNILYRYWPFIYRWKSVKPDELESAEIRKYSAWKEFGGRGYKFRILSRKGKSFTLRGDQGLQLIFKNGKKLLIGTQRPEELKVALRKMLMADIE